MHVLNKRHLQFLDTQFLITIFVLLHWAGNSYSYSIVIVIV